MCSITDQMTGGDITDQTGIFPREPGAPFLKYKFIYLFFILLGLHCHSGFSLVGREQGLLASCSA